ncbi:MAG: hypothetical protein ACRDYB_08010 [Acidimicrobiales bacterium]
MTDGPDFRSDKSDSVEGDRRAATRWDGYHLNLDGDVLAEAFPSSGRSVEDYPEFVRDDIAADAMEESELIGFWVAWHLAGGFVALESGGWHRATIFRKVRRFRARYGVHPDEYSFPWITLDLEKAWAAKVAGRIRTNRGDTPA